MQLTTVQEATFKNWLAANAAALSDQAAADLANTPASPAYNLWQVAVDRSVIDALIVKANYTPTDNPPASTNTTQGTNDALLYNNRALACQLKQFNMQWLTQGQSPLDARSAQLRQNFSDCMTAIPSGGGGAAQNAGWGTVGAVGAVRAALMRQATNFEKLYVTAASGAGNDGASARGNALNPDQPGVDGVGQPILSPVTASDVAQARASG